MADANETGLAGFVSCSGLAEHGFHPCVAAGFCLIEGCRTALIAEVGIGTFGEQEF